MKHFGNQLDEIFRKKKVVQKDFAEKMGVTPQTVTKWKAKDTMEADTLEAISKVLNIPITYWFDEEKPVNQSVANGEGSAASIYGDATVSVSSTEKDKEIEHLKALLKEKERIIQILLDKRD